jgi:hypothetical protein
MGNVGRALSLLLLATGLAGCPCTDLADAEIQDPHDLATPEQEAEIRQAMDEFAAWSRVSELCVDAVRVRYIPREGVGGSFFCDRDVIALDPTALDQAGPMVFHELCHAWDWAMGYPSLDNRGLFRAESVPLDDSYPTADHRVAEAFARACEEAPQPIDLRPGLEQACGFELLSEQQRWMMEHVFPHFEPDWNYAGTFEAGISEVTTTSYTELGWAHSSDANGHLYAFYEGELWWSPPDRGLVSAIDTVGLDDRRPLPRERLTTVLEFQLRTGALTSTRQFPSPGGKAYRTARAYQAPSGSLFMASDGHRTAGVFIEPNGGAVTQVTYPEELGFPYKGVSRRDRGWFAATLDAEDREIVAEIDLSTGSWREIDLLLGDQAFDLWSSRLFDLGDELLIAYDSVDKPLRLFHYNPDTNEIRREQVWSGKPLWGWFMAVLDDGRWVITATLTLHKGSNDEPGDYRNLLILYEPDTGRWWIDPMTCEQGWYGDMGQRTPGYALLMSHEGSIYVVTESLERTPTLLRLDIPPREALLPRP